MLTARAQFDFSHMGMLEQRTSFMLAFEIERKIIKICARYFPPIFVLLLLLHSYDISNLESILSFINLKVIDCNSASTKNGRAQTKLFTECLMCELGRHPIAWSCEHSKLIEMLFYVRFHRSSGKIGRKIDSISFSFLSFRKYNISLTGASNINSFQLVIHVLYFSPSNE